MQFQTKLILQIQQFLVLSILDFDKFTTGEISTSNNQFGLKLYGNTALNSEGDFVVSPFPLTTLFAALYSKADGDLRKEIGDSLQFLGDENTPDVIRDYKRVVKDFSDIESLKNIQASLFVNDSLKLGKEFQSILQDDLNIMEIATDVSAFNETKDKILDWMNPPKNFSVVVQFFEDKLEENTTMILLTKSFFKGAWVHRFRPSLTKPSPFFYDETHSNQVEMMFTRAHVPYAEISELDCTAVALPYDSNIIAERDNQTGVDVESVGDNHRLELIILLPNSRTGLPELETRLKNYPFSRIPQQFLETKDMFLYIPKFNVSSIVDLSDVISELGIKSLTNPENVDELSKILQESEKKVIKISNIFQFVQFSIDENGSSENDSTVPLPNLSIKYNSPESFRANRPFIGFLYDQEKHIILNIFRKTS